MNGHMGGGSAASAISSLPSSLPGQSISSPLSQKLASAPDAEHRRMMLGELRCPPSRGGLVWSRLWLPSLQQAAC